MDGATSMAKGFVESTPKGHRPKERADHVRMLAAAIETTLERHPQRGLAVCFGLESIERPRHDLSSNLAEQLAELAFKRQGCCRRWLRVDKPLKEPGAPGEQARKLQDERVKGRCQQGLDWHRMDHGGAPTW